MTSRRPRYSERNGGAVNVPSVSIGRRKFRVTVVRSRLAQAKGLLGHAKLEPDEGMLFVYPRPIPRTFHTVGMRFPIDILWIDETDTVVGVSSAPPGGWFSAPKPVRYVLELPFGAGKTFLGKTVTAFDKLD